MGCSTLSAGCSALGNRLKTQQALPPCTAGPSCAVTLAGNATPQGPRLSWGLLARVRSSLLLSDNVQPVSCKDVVMSAVSHLSL